MLHHPVATFVVALYFGTRTFHSTPRCSTVILWFCLVCSEGRPACTFCAYSSVWPTAWSHFARSRLSSALSVLSSQPGCLYSFLPTAAQGGPSSFWFSRDTHQTPFRIRQVVSQLKKDVCWTKAYRRNLHRSGWCACGVVCGSSPAGTCTWALSASLFLSRLALARVECERGAFALV